MTEKLSDRDRPNDDGTPGQEVTRVRERCEKSHPEASGGHRVEHAVRGCRHEKERPQPRPACAGGPRTEHQRGRYRREYGREEERVRETTVSEHVLIWDAEPERDDV